MSGNPDTAEIKALLIANIEALARELVPTGSRSGHYWIGACPWRNDQRAGSFWVNLAGSKFPGTWKDAATGEKGDVLRLIAMAIGTRDFNETKRWAMGFLGLGSMPPEQRKAMIKKVEDDAEHREKREAEKLAENRKGALAKWIGARPLAGSVAERYLASRCIDITKLPRMPRALRCLDFHKHYESGKHFPCMIAQMTGPDGTCWAVHRTWLQSDGSGKAPVTPAKKIWPSYMGSAIRVWRGKDNLTEREAREAGLRERLVLTEGIENALSVAIADPDPRIWAVGTLGNLGAVVLPECCDEVVVVADNDWGNPRAQAQLAAALDRFVRMGVKVRIARSHVGKDVNDALRGAA